MFGATNTSSPFGGTNNGNGNSLFGAKPATTGSSGFSFGSNNNTNAANTSSGTLFGNSGANTQSPGGLFGNGTAQKQQSSAGDMFGNKQATSGGLFGNNNTNAQSTPGLFANNAANTSSGGLFSNNATSSPAPSGSLFGNAAKPSLFGSNNATPAKPSLFGSTNATQQRAQQTGGLFGSLNNNSTTVPPQSSLFGNSTAATATLNPMMSATPVKQYNFKDLPKSLTDSTKTNKTINVNQATRKRSISNTPSTMQSVDIARSSLMEKLGSRFSTMSSSGIYNSQGLFSPKKDMIQSSHPTDKNSETTRYSRNHLYKSFASGTLTTRSSRAPRTTATDYLKLKVDPSRTEARKLKLFGEAGGAKKVRILGRDEGNVLSIKESSENAETNDHFLGPGETAIPQTPKVEPEVEEADIKPATDDYDGYWCSPSISELQSLPLRLLADVSGFTIGRIGYGVISFDLPVDLSGLWSDLPGNLFGNVVRFSKRGTVEVYPRGSVPLGTGLNVPATITLDKVFPVSKRKSAVTDTTSKDLEFRLFVQRLKEMKDMEFVSYDRINGSWTFKVKHFSIWGLVDEDDAVVDVESEIEQLKKEEEHQSQSPASVAGNPSFIKREIRRSISPLVHNINPTENTFLYKRQKQDNIELDNTAYMPGSFITEDIYQQVRHIDGHLEEEPAPEDKRNILSELDSEDEIFDQDNAPLGLVTHGDESFLNEEDGIIERQFEPENVDDTDFEILDADPKLAVADDWDRQLEISARFDSAFSNKTLKTTTIYDAPFSKALTPGDFDKLLYGDFEKVVKSRTAIKKELRLSGYEFGSFSTFNSVLIPTENTPSHIKCKSLDSFYGAQSQISLYQRHISASIIVERKNRYPHVVKNELLSFKLVKESLHDSISTSEKTIWELASILFDNNINDSLNDVSDLEVVNRVLEIERREGLISWIKKEIQPEIDEKLEDVTNPFEQIFLLLASFNISSAAKHAIKTKSPHLAVLISLLGSNDPGVKHGADMQLKEWRKHAVLQTIPDGLVKVYHLLKGDILDPDVIGLLATSLSWKAKLGLLLYYGDLNYSLSESLLSFTQSESSSVPAEDLIYFNLIKLYVCKNDSTFNIADIFSTLKTPGSLDVRLQWYIYEILVRSTQQMTFGGNAEFGDRLTLLFAEQLQSNGLWTESLFVLAHLTNDDACKSNITKLISSHVGELTSDSVLPDMQRLRLPQSLWSESKALFYRYSGDHWNEASSLLDAELFDEAHRCMIQYVAPAAVINNGSKLRELEKLIARFPERRHIDDWNIGLGVYKDYLRVVFSKGTQESQLRYLVDNIPLMAQSNFKVKVATKLMSKAVAVKIAELQAKDGNRILDLSEDKISKLPLGESDRSMVLMLQDCLKREYLAC